MSQVTHLGFTGHRNRVTRLKYLDELREQYPGAVWVHGGAKHGFDAQVHGYAQVWAIPEHIIRPRYDEHPDNPKYAPIARNFEIVDLVQRVVGCWDGKRRTGGTYRTLMYAKEQGKPRLPVEACEPLFLSSLESGMTQTLESVWAGSYQPPVRYWSHPESDSLWASLIEEGGGADGLVMELTREQYLTYLAEVRQAREARR